MSLGIPFVRMRCEDLYVEPLTDSAPLSSPGAKVNFQILHDSFHINGLVML